MSVPDVIACLVAIALPASSTLPILTQLGKTEVTATGSGCELPEPSIASLEYECLSYAQVTDVVSLLIGAAAVIVALLRPAWMHGAVLGSIVGLIWLPREIVNIFATKNPEYAAWVYGFIFVGAGACVAWVWGTRGRVDTETQES